MNMSNEQAIQILIPMRNMMYDQNGCPISDAAFALDKAIEALSTDRPQGYWISNHDGSWNCSECGLRVLMYAKGNYCPNCGADMRNSSENPNNCEAQTWTKENCKGCRYNEYPYDSGTCFVRVCINGNKYEPKTEPHHSGEVTEMVEPQSNILLDAMAKAFGVETEPQTEVTTDCRLTESEGE